jgi:hypothetical protein
VSAQAKPISEVVKDFEQSLGNLRPSTERVYVAGARAAIRAASLELWQSPSTTDLLASIGKSPTEKRARISPFLDFLGDGGSKQSVSDKEIVALRNLVIQLRARNRADQSGTRHSRSGEEGLAKDRHRRIAVVAADVRYETWLGFGGPGSRISTQDHNTPGTGWHFCIGIANLEEDRGNV